LYLKRQEKENKDRFLDQTIDVARENQAKSQLSSDEKKRKSRRAQEMKSRILAAGNKAAAELQSTLQQKMDQAQKKQPERVYMLTES
jgi:hypothetical protein